MAGPLVSLAGHTGFESESESETPRDTKNNDGMSRKRFSEARLEASRKTKDDSVLIWESVDELEI
jgi:hypothetical protein